MPPTGEGAPAFEADVVVIGSGFGGSAAALRFAEAGHRVVVIERGDEVVWSAFRPDLDMFWSPRRQRFGMNNLKRRGRHVVTWTGAAVGGGSHVYAATLKRVPEANQKDPPVLVTGQHGDSGNEQEVGADPVPNACDVGRDGHPATVDSPVCSSWSTTGRGAADEHHARRGARSRNRDSAPSRSARGRGRPRSTSMRRGDSE